MTHQRTGWRSVAAIGAAMLLLALSACDGGEDVGDAAGADTSPAVGSVASPTEPPSEPPDSRATTPAETPASSSTREPDVPSASPTTADAPTMEPTAATTAIPPSTSTEPPTAPTEPPLPEPTSDPGGTRVSTGWAEVRTSISGFTFASKLAISAPGAIQWTNTHDQPHDVVAVDGTFASETLETGDSFRVEFDQAGTYEYFCSIHPFMTGTVTIR